MVGLWIFGCVFVICATIVICVFLKCEGVSKWDMRQNLRNIESRLSSIDRTLDNMANRKDGVK